MALRIKPDNYKPPQDPEESAEEPIEQEQPAEPLMEEAPMLPMADMPQPGGQVDPEAARYFPREYMCAGCIHFMEPSTCEIVAGEIDPEGICSLFVPDAADMAADQTLVEAPVEEPMEPTNGLDNRIPKTA